MVQALALDYHLWYWVYLRYVRLGYAHWVIRGHEFEECLTGAGAGAMMSARVPDTPTPHMVVLHRHADRIVQILCQHLRILHQEDPSGIVPGLFRRECWLEPWLGKGFQDMLLLLRSFIAVAVTPVPMKWLLNQVDCPDQHPPVHTRARCHEAFPLALRYLDKVLEVLPQPASAHEHSLNPPVDANHTYGVLRINVWTLREQIVLLYSLLRSPIDGNEQEVARGDLSHATQNVSSGGLVCGTECVLEVLIWAQTRSENGNDTRRVRIQNVSPEFIPSQSRDCEKSQNAATNTTIRETVASLENPVAFCDRHRTTKEEPAHLPAQDTGCELTNRTNDGLPSNDYAHRAMMFLEDLAASVLTEEPSDPISAMIQRLSKEIAQRSKNDGVQLA